MLKTWLVCSVFYFTFLNLISCLLFSVVHQFCWHIAKTSTEATINNRNKKIQQFNKKWRTLEDWRSCMETLTSQVSKWNSDMLVCGCTIWAKYSAEWIILQWATKWCNPKDQIQPKRPRPYMNPQSQYTVIQYYVNGYDIKGLKMLKVTFQFHQGDDVGNGNSSTPT